MRLGVRSGGAPLPTFHHPLSGIWLRSNGASTGIAAVRLLKILTISNAKNGPKCGNSLTSFTFPNDSDFHAENASGTVS
jgi:hypothetical protein